MNLEADVLKLSDCDLSPEKIIVKHSGFVVLSPRVDPDGDLIIAETGRSLPLEEVPRVYRRNVKNPDSISGKHAHKETKQIIFCASGSFLLHLDDGQNKQDIFLDVEHIGIKLWPRLWHTMSNFERNTVVLVHASTYFDESDYIRDYQQFLSYVESMRELVD